LLKNDKIVIEQTVTDACQVKKTTTSSSVTSSSSVGSAAGPEAGVEISSELARQKKRDSMLFGDVDEPPLIMAGGDQYHAARSSDQYRAARSDTGLSTSSTSVGSGQLIMSGRTVSEPAFSQTTTKSQESFVSRSDEALGRSGHEGLGHGGRYSDDKTGRVLESSDGSNRSRQTGRILESSDRSRQSGRVLESSDGSFDTVGSVVWRGDRVPQDTIGHSSMTESWSTSGGGGGGGDGGAAGGRQVYFTETRVERQHSGQSRLII